jgi:hypothetical protein
MIRLDFVSTRENTHEPLMIYVKSRNACERCAPNAARSGCGTTSCPGSNAMYAPRPAAANSGSRVAVVALLAIAVVLFSEERALADGDPTVQIIYYWVIGGSAAGAASVPFLVADVVYTAEHRWLPPGWAIPQIVIGGGVNAAVAVWGIESYSGKDCVGGGPTSARSAVPGAAPPLSPPNACGNILPVVIGTTVLSVGFIAHGVASLVLYEPAPARKASGGIGLKSDGAYLRWVPDIAVTRDGKTFVAFSGVF